MSYFVSSFVLPKQRWDIKLSISRIYEDIADCLYEYTMGEAAQSHWTVLQNQDAKKC